MKVSTEVDGIIVEINSNRMLDLSGLTTFMKSLNAGAVVIKSPDTPVKRGRGRPAGSSKKGVRK